jgi:hypothetical protein
VQSVFFVVGLFVFDHRGDGAITVRGIEEGVAEANGDGVAESTVIFANFDGGVVRPGQTNSALDRSSLVEGERYLPPADLDDEDEAAVVDCLSATFAPFGVTVTTEAPAAGVRHIEAMFGGEADDILDDVDDDARIAGVSPFRADCSVIEDSIVFIFTEALHHDVQEMCETAAHEIGHSYGLDHQLLASDPMTYLHYNGERRFRDETAACGERDPRPCGLVDHGFPACRPDQNTAALLHQRLVGDGQSPIDPDDPDPDSDQDPSSTPPPNNGNDLFASGCSTAGDKVASLLVGLALIALIRRR